MSIDDFKIGQSITAGVWFRCGRYGDCVDYACIVGTVIGKMECYNKILVDVDIPKSFNSPSKSLWVDIAKSDISINN